MKVGDYVRTRQGNIFKWDKYMTTTKEECREVDSPYIYINQNDIIKSSPNIIDLIEVGDYVNGYKVDGLDLGTTGEKIRLHTDSYDNLDFNNNEIKSIVTREQFSQMEYKIGE